VSVDGIDRNHGEYCPTTRNRLLFAAETFFPHFRQDSDLGRGCSYHIQEAVEEIFVVPGSGGSFGVVLDGDDRQGPMFQTLYCIVVQV